MIECARIKMSRMLPKCLGVALLSSSLVLFIAVQAQPIFRQQRVIEDDPLMALPSDHQHAPQEVQYVTYQQVVATPQQYHQAADQKQQVVVEYQQAQERQQQHHEPQFVYTQEQSAGAPYQLIQVSAQEQQQQGQNTPNGVHAHAANGPDCHLRHEFTSLLSLENPGSQQVVAGEQQQQQQQQQSEYLPASQIKSERPRGEYPGEIIYVGQNGQSEQQQQLSGLHNVASSLARNSDVSATILTEIPIKDMPYEVLSKLKREYGVKVVATRDRPGANLVINCDDYPNQEGSVCGRREQHEHQPHVGHRQQQQQEQHQRQQQQQQQQQPHFTYLTAAEPSGHMVESLPAEQHHRATTFHIDHVVQPASEPANAYVAEHEPSRGPSEQPALTELTYPSQPTSAGPHESMATGVIEDQRPNTEGSDYGTRTSVTDSGEQQSGGEANETTQAVPNEANQQENSSATSEQYQPGASPEPVDQHTGFDEQPKSNEP